MKEEREEEDVIEEEVNAANEDVVIEGTTEDKITNTITYTGEGMTIYQTKLKSLLKNIYCY